MAGFYPFSEPAGERHRPVVFSEGLVVWRSNYTYPTQRAAEKAAAQAFGEALSELFAHKEHPGSDALDDPPDF